MADTLRQLRRGATQLAIRTALAATAVLPMGLDRAAVRGVVALAGGLPMLRRKVRRNMRLALGDDVPAEAEGRYFRHLAWLYSNSLTAFRSGVAATPLPNEVKFDESVRLLDEAVAEGRGVVLTSPHWLGHELVAAIINLRHPVAMFVRQAPTAERALRKLKWYRALGAEIVLRPDRASSIEDAVAYLRVLRKGKLLAITPDLLADPGQGVETSIFGRPARLQGGAFTLAILAKAPLIRVSGRWQSDSTITVMFDRAPLPLDARDRDAAVRAAVQDWCCWFEEKLRQNPDTWLFWLDKRWSRFLQATPRASGAK
jgi:lauroyl/myristoyl acyltransferase